MRLALLLLAPLAQALNFGSYPEANVLSREETSRVFPELTFVDPSRIGFISLAFNAPEKTGVPLVTNCYLTVEYPYEIVLNTTTNVKLCHVQDDSIVWCRPFEEVYLHPDITYLLYSDTPYAVVSITWTIHLTHQERQVVHDLLRVNSQLKVPMYAEDFPQPPPLKKIHQKLNEQYTSKFHEVLESNIKELGVIADIQEYFKDLMFDTSAPRCPILSEKDSREYFPRVTFNRLTIGGAVYNSKTLNPTALPEDHLITVVDSKVQSRSVFDRTEFTFQKSGRCDSIELFLEKEGIVQKSTIVLHTISNFKFGF